MPYPGRYQVQLRPEEYVTIVAALKHFATTAAMTDIEVAITQSVIAHMERAKLSRAS
jgi:phage gp16-like protein